MVVCAAEDYYDVLGVGKSADKKEIKSAYRQKARRPAVSSPQPTSLHSQRKALRYTTRRMRRGYT